MHYILRVQLSGFYSEVASRQLGDIVAVHRGKKVLCAPQPALDRGVQVGMPLAEAKAIWPSGKFVAWQEDHYTQEQERWLNLCAEYSDRIEPDEQHACFVDLTGHPDPAEISRKLGGELALHGYLCQLGLARSKWIATLAAMPLTGDSILDEVRLLDPIRDTAGYICALPVSQLLPASEPHRARLAFLGYRTIGEVAELSLETLKAQFLEQGLLIHQAARGEGNDLVEPVFPFGAIQRRFSFEGCTSDRETFECGLRHIAARLSEALEEMDSHGSRLSLRLEFDDGSRITLERTFAKALRSKFGIMSAISAMVDRRIDRPVAAISARLPNLSKNRSRQLALNGSICDRKSSAEIAVAELSNAVGPDAVKLGSAVELSRRRRVLKEWKRVTGWQ